MSSLKFDYNGLRGLPTVSQITRNYCRDCNWSVSTDDHDRQELARLAIEHATESGHDIDSEFE